MIHPQSENLVRAEMCRVGKSLFDRGYVHATAGNISVRLEDHKGGGFLITPTDACLGFLDPARLSRLDSDGNHLDGDLPSKTFELHSRIYRAAGAFDSNVRCIVHTHSTYSVALTLNTAKLPLRPQGFHELLPVITPYFAIKVGSVPVIPYAYPGSLQSAEHVERAIQTYGEAGCNIRAVVLERLGPNVWHHTPQQAMAALEELEETAKLYWLTHQRTEELSPEQLAELRNRFG